MSSGPSYTAANCQMRASNLVPIDQRVVKKTLRLAGRRQVKENRSARQAEFRSVAASYGRYHDLS